METQNVSVICRDLDLTDTEKSFYGFTDGNQTVIFRTRNQEVAKGYLILHMRDDADNFEPIENGEPLHLEGYGI